jgi:hypothetical protein
MKMMKSISRGQEAREVVRVIGIIMLRLMMAIEANILLYSKYVAGYISDLWIYEKKTHSPEIMISSFIVKVKCISHLCVHVLVSIGFMLTK